SNIPSLAQGAETEIRYIGRDSSWLAFNQRVLEEAQDAELPILERAKFLAIVVTNLDEFSMVRMPELRQGIGVTNPDGSGMSGLEHFINARTILHRQIKETYACWRQDVEVALREGDIDVNIIPPSRWSNIEVESLASHYRDTVEPTLTPLAVDPTRPIPLIANLALCIAVSVRADSQNETQQALVVVPKMGRLIALPGTNQRFALLEDVIEYFLAALFPGYEIVATAQFRLTRDASLEIDEDGAGDFLSELEEELRNRGRGRSMRLEILDHGDPDLIEWVRESLSIDGDDMVAVPGPLDLSLLFSLPNLLKRPDLEYPPFVPRLHIGAQQCPFGLLREQELLLHHPYDSFDPIVALVRSAAADPQVLAIKQTLYRVSGDSPIVHALVDAAHQGKQVTVLVELKARFDEAANIRWARRLEEAGAHVVYGLMGLKVHAKLLMIIRRDEDGLRRYCHLGTGNYNDKTARFYTDISYLTSNQAVGRDVAALFNVLTGYAQPPDWERLEAAPSTMRKRFVQWIRFEADQARSGHPSRIVAKFNSMVDEAIAEELYLASQAGVRIDLIIRGMCILRAGVPGLSENIQVRSVIGRYLEHSRIFYFYHAGAPIHAIASADWMTRNLDRRVEHLVVITNPQITKRIDHILRVFLNDRQRSRCLGLDGKYLRIRDLGDNDGLDAQAFFALSESQQRRHAEEQWHAQGIDPLIP
ncbi:MAG: polyphosphate kinase 1, partial [Planctomycetota bacterium]